MTQSTASSTHSTSLSQPAFPKGIGPLFFINFTANFSVALLFVSIVLYSTDYFAFTNAKANALFGAFASLLFGSAIIGGYLAKWINSVVLFIWSAIFTVAGMAVLAIPSVETLYLGLGMFIMGFCLYSPVVNYFLSMLYEPDNAKRFSGFTLAYIGNNLGATCAAVFGGVISYYVAKNIDNKDWTQYAFLISSVCTLSGYIYFFTQYRKFNYRSSFKGFTRVFTNVGVEHLITALLSLVILAVFLFLLTQPSYNNSFLITCAIITIIYMLVKSRTTPRQQRKNIYILLFLILVSISFWLLYMTSPSLLTEFIVDGVQHKIFGIPIPTETFWGFGPFFIVTLGIFFTWLWNSLAKHGKDPSEFLKFALGLFSIGIAYACTTYSIHKVMHVPHLKVEGYWIMLSYFLQTCGELLIGPAGFAMIGKYAPANLETTFLGFWQLGIGLGASFAGMYGASLAVPKTASLAVAKPLYAAAFYTLSQTTIILSIGVLLVWLTLKLVKRAS